MIISNELTSSLVKASKKTEILPFDDINRVRYTSTIETGRNNKMGGRGGSSFLAYTQWNDDRYIGYMHNCSKMVIGQ